MASKRRAPRVVQGLRIIYREGYQVKRFLRRDGAWTLNRYDAAVFPSRQVDSVIAKHRRNFDEREMSFGSLAAPTAKT